MTEPWEEITEYGDESAQLPEEVLLVAQATTTPGSSSLATTSQTKAVPIKLIYASSLEAKKIGSADFKKILPKMIKDVLEKHLVNHTFQVDFYRDVADTPADANKTVFVYLVFGSATAIEIAKNRFSNFAGSSAEAGLAKLLTNEASVMIEGVGEKGRYCFCNFDVYDVKASELFSEVENQSEKATELFGSLVLHEIGHCFGASHDDNGANIMNKMAPTDLSEKAILTFSNTAVNEMKSFLKGWP